MYRGKAKNNRKHPNASKARTIKQNIRNKLFRKYNFAVTDRKNTNVCTICRKKTISQFNDDSFDFELVEYEIPRYLHEAAKPERQTKQTSIDKNALVHYNRITSGHCKKLCGLTKEQIKHTKDVIKNNLMPFYEHKHTFYFMSTIDVMIIINVISLVLVKQENWIWCIVILVAALLIFPHVSNVLEEYVMIVLQMIHIMDIVKHV